jgi:hypothetical protein
LAAYFLHVQKLEKDFEVLDLQHVCHANNIVADELLTKASTWALVPDEVLERRLLRPTAWPTKPGKGGETSTSKLAVPMVLIPWSPPRIVGVMGDSVHPGVQDPDAQVSLVALITKIWTYLKDNILPDDSTSADQISTSVAPIVS